MRDVGTRSRARRHAHDDTAIPGATTWRLRLRRMNWPMNIWISLAIGSAINLDVYARATAAISSDLHSTLIDYSIVATWGAAVYGPIIWGLSELVLLIT